jgi:hypothetical protein
MVLPRNGRPPRRIAGRRNAIILAASAGVNFFGPRCLWAASLDHALAPAAQSSNTPGNIPGNTPGNISGS